MENPEASGRKSFRDIRNVRLFTIYRVLFNARYYYPVFTLIFLDFGLTLEEFALLNVIWAATIVTAEVPSGALADITGRRNLLLAGAILMIIEMGVLCLVPIDAPLLLFPMFLINRVCSGLAEAMVSGADEAIAYDSLDLEGDTSQWPDVLERTARIGAAAMCAAMIIGAFLYDPDKLGATLRFIGIDVTLQKEDVIRLPVLLTLVHAVVVLWAALRMREPESFQREEFSLQLIRKSFAKIWEAIRWTFGHRFILFVILAGMVVDSTARHFIILNVKYLERIEIPVAWFGIIAAAFSFTGILWAKFGRHLARNHSPVFNLGVLSLILFVSLFGIQLMIPVYGFLFTAGTYAMFGLVSFLQSHYINAYTDSGKRATVLSLKSFANNVGLGVASLLYTALIYAIKRDAQIEDPEALQNHAFDASLGWMPGYLVALLALLVLGGAFMIRDKSKLLRVT